MSRIRNGILCLSRAVGQSVIVTAPDGQRVEVMYAGKRGPDIVLAFRAPQSFEVNRLELQEIKDLERLHEAEKVSEETRSSGNSPADESASKRSDP